MKNKPTLCTPIQLYHFIYVMVMFYQRFSNFDNVHEDTKVALSNLSNNLLYTFASAERVFSILDEEPMVEEIDMYGNNSY